MRLIFIIVALCLVKLNFARTITQHHETTIHSNGDKTTKTWTLKNSDEQENVPSMLPNGFSKLNIEPHMETVNIGSSNIPTDELLKHEGLTSGMDPLAVGELLKTKQPVIKTALDDKGRTSTTTYRLNSDGSISRHSITQSQPFTRMMNRNDFDVENVSIDELMKLDQPVLKTYRDEDGNIVRKTYKVPTTDDDNKPFLITSNNKPHDVTPNSKSPDNTNIFERRHRPRERDENDGPILKFPESLNPNIWDKENKRPSFFDTDRQSNEKPTTFLFNENDFDGIDTATPGTYTKTSVDDQGRTIKTTYTIGPTTFIRKKFNFPSWVDEPRSLWVDKPTVKTTTQLPSLEDFLKSQYETTTTTLRLTPPSTTTTVRTTHKTTTVSNAEKPATKINIDDLPVMDPHTTIKTFSINNIPKATDFDTELLSNPETSKVESRIDSYATTLTTNNVPTLNDLDSKIRDVLIKAGITDEDLKNSNGESITKTRVSPTGAIIKTTFRLKTIPTTVNVDPLDKTKDIDENIHLFDAPKTTPTLFTPRTSIFRDKSDDFPNLKYPTFTKTHPIYELQPFQPIAPKRSLIDEFLAKINLSASDILAKKGELVKTIVEDNGRILTATFVLSDIKDETNKKKEHYESESESKPLK